MVQLVDLIDLVLIKECVEQLSGFLGGSVLRLRFGLFHMHFLELALAFIDDKFFLCQ